MERRERPKQIELLRAREIQRETARNRYRESEHRETNKRDESDKHINGLT